MIAKGTIYRKISRSDINRGQKIKQFKCEKVKPTYTDIGQLRNLEHGLKIK